MLLFSFYRDGRLFLAGLELVQKRQEHLFAHLALNLPLLVGVDEELRQLHVKLPVCKAYVGNAFERLLVQNLP